MKSPQITRVFLLIVVSLLKVLTFSTRTIHHLPFLCSFIPPLPVGSLRFQKEPQRENYMKFLLQSSFPLITTELIHVFMTSTRFFYCCFPPPVNENCLWKLSKTFPEQQRLGWPFCFIRQHSGGTVRRRDEISICPGGGFVSGRMSFCQRKSKGILETIVLGIYCHGTDIEEILDAMTKWGLKNWSCADSWLSLFKIKSNDLSLNVYSAKVMAHQ